MEYLYVVSTTCLYGEKHIYTDVYPKLFDRPWRALYAAMRQVRGQLVGDPAYNEEPAHIVKFERPWRNAVVLEDSRGNTYVCEITMV